MKITIFSFLMAVIWGSVLIGIIYLIRKKNVFSRKLGITSLVLLYVFCGVRMLVPIDFSFSRGIYLVGTFAEISDFLGTPFFHIGVFQGTVISCLAAIWILGAIILLLRFAIQYTWIFRKIGCIPEWNAQQCLDAMKKVYQKTGKRINVSVYKGDFYDVPIGAGVFKRKIILPDHNYSDSQLYYILLHEYTHFLNRDLVVKFTVHIYCCVFWWNPVSYLLQRDLEQTLEIQCDLCITEGKNNVETAEYLQTIVTALKEAGSRQKYSILHGTARLADDPENELKERFEIVLKNNKMNMSRIKSVITCLIGFVVLLAVSYSFIPMPGYQPPIEEIETGPNAYEITTDNSYITEENGLYYWILEIDGKADAEEVTEEAAREFEAEGFEIRR